VLHLSEETELLARRVAILSGREPEDLIRSALEREAEALGIADEPERKRHRPTVEEILEFGRRAAKRPILDPRSPKEISDDLNEI
jgi:antitoxin VapB